MAGTGDHIETPDSDPEPQRYYDWMLWKLRQEKKMEQDDPMDDITKGGSLSGWTEKPYISPQQMWEREIAEMQKTNHALMLRIKEQAEEIEKLKNPFIRVIWEDIPGNFTKERLRRVLKLVMEIGVRRTSSCTMTA